MKKCWLLFALAALLTLGLAAGAAAEDTHEHVWVYTSIDGQTHQVQCSVCQTGWTENHANPCNNPGVCKFCGTPCPGVELYHDNDYWEVQSNEQEHWYVCTLCNTVIENGRGPHTRSCGSTEEKCSECDYYPTTTVIHIINDDAPLQYNEQNHWQVCVGCGAAMTKYPHTLQYNSQTGKDACTECDYTQPHTHSWVVTGTGSWYHNLKCEGCGREVEEEPCRAYCDTNGRCVVCGEERPNRFYHRYDESAPQSDGNEHWWICTSCGQEADRASHFDSCESGDGLCDICGKPTANVSHEVAVGTPMQWDETNHWTPCEHCGAPAEVDPHEFVDDVCRWCGYSRAHVHSWTAGPESKPTCQEAGSITYTCACGATYTESTGAPLGHNFASFYSRGDGTERSDCTRCGTFTVRNCSMTTQVVDGETRRVCGNCGYTEVIATAAPAPAATPEPTAEPAPAATAAPATPVPVADVQIESVGDAALPESAVLTVKDITAVSAAANDGAEEAPAAAELPPAPVLEKIEEIGPVATFSVAMEVKTETTTKVEGSVKISIPYAGETAGMKLVLIRENGETVEIEFVIENGRLVFVTEELGVFALVPTAE